VTPMTKQEHAPQPAGGTPVDRRVGRLDTERCHADRDGDCTDARCPQPRGREPSASGRHCPLDVRDTDDSWLDDDDDCGHCRGDGMDPDCDYLLPCPACQAEQRP
jgi:hypothetical protein